jgi:hypothetical protein
VEIDARAPLTEVVHALERIASKGSDPLTN